MLARLFQGAKLLRSKRSLKGGYSGTASTAVICYLVQPYHACLQKSILFSLYYKMSRVCLLLSIPAVSYQEAIFGNAVIQTNHIAALECWLGILQPVMPNKYGRRICGVEVDVQVCRQLLRLHGGRATKQQVTIANFGVGEPPLYPVGGAAMTIFIIPDIFLRDVDLFSF